MKKLHKLFFFTIFALSFVFMISCSTKNGYIDSSVCYPKISYLEPVMDELSFETVYIQGTSYTTTTSNSTATLTHTANLFNDPTVNTLAPIPQVKQNATVTQETIYVKNPMIKIIRDVLVNETRNYICDAGEKKGTIVWSVNTDAAKDLNIYKVCWCPIFWPAPLFGFPLKRCDRYCSLTASIYDNNGNFLGSYTASYKDRQWGALYWGYKYYKASSIAKWNARQLALNDIKKQISADAERLNSLLNQ